MRTRSFIVWAVGIAAVTVPFLGFVILGWPGAPDSCVAGSPNTCYCEAFVSAEVSSGVGGVRQPSNTWFNLYAIATALIVAGVVFFDRTAGRAANPIQSRGWIPDVYTFAVLFLGLGSMWFHASLKGWAGNLDGLSMYAFAAFLVFYTARRIWPHDLVFWVGYPLTVGAFTLIGALWQAELKSLVLIGVLVVAYLALEVTAVLTGRSIPQGRLGPLLLWLAAVASILTATVFWYLSQTGRPLCDPGSFWQPHGLLWHPLAGVMAVLLFFYWRSERPTVG